MGRVDETESIGVTVLTAPDKLQLSTPERAARVNWYREMKENLVTFINAFGPFGDPDAMDEKGRINREKMNDTPVARNGKDGKDDDHFLVFTIGM